VRRHDDLTFFGSQSFIHQDTSGRRRLEASEQPQQGRLSAAARSYDPNVRCFAERCRDGSYSNSFPIGLRHRLHLEIHRDLLLSKAKKIESSTAAEAM
jgi:hypothetical protein